MPSKHEEKMIDLQVQMRQNQAELKDYLAEMDNWEKDIKQKEEKLIAGKSEKKDELPPVRNTIHKKKLKKKRKEKPADSQKAKRIPGSDFRAWDKFDVDKALEEIDKEEKKDTSSSEYETDEEWEMERKKHLAGLEKEKGNNFLKQGDYDNAIEAYSKGIEYDATSAILPANRAMALLKQQKFAAAELDCTTSISLDPLYVKAYLRRATARSGMEKLKEAVEDFNRVLDIEPANKLAKTELERLSKQLKREKEGPVVSSLTDGNVGIVKPIYKPPEERSKEPLVRVAIEEIGLETRTKPEKVVQSDVAKKITEKEGAEFDKLFKSGPTTRNVPSSPSSAQQSQEINSPSAEDTNKCSNQYSPATHDTDLSNHAAAGLRDKVLSNDAQNIDSSHPTTSDSSSIKSVSAQKLASADESQKTMPAPSAGASKTETNHQQTAAAVQMTNGDSSSHVGGSGDGFDVPQTSFQFQADFKLLKNKPDVFFKYFTAIDPPQYPKLFGQSLDADILNAVLKSLASHCDTDESLDMFKILTHLSKVKRFSMTAMFLSKKDKQVAQSLMQKLTSSGKYSDSDIAALSKTYDL